MPTDLVRTQSTIRFGRVFELEPGLYELRRSGRPVKLERIPMEILLLLVRERGRVVARQEIVDHVWGKDISIDADNSINGAIRKIRQVLRDDPEQPRFIQTITGRGYRFIAEIQPEQAARVSAAGQPSATAPPDLAIEASPIAATLESGPSAEPVPPIAAIPVPPVSAPRSRRWFFALVACAVAVLAISSLFVWRKWPSKHAAAPQGKLRLAVLPFQNLTGDVSQDYFSDGVTEEMIAEIGRLDPDHLAVIARTSVMYYKGTHVPVRQIARDLGVQYVLEGSVRRDENQVRITAQLIQADDETHVWARRFDHPTDDLLSMQSEIASEIAHEIQLTLRDRKPITAASRAALSSSSEYEAFDLYLKGRYLWSKRTPEGLRSAVTWFQQAIARDPNYAGAYAGLADTYAILSSYGYAPAGVYMPQARTAALKALALDNSLAEGHTSLALIAQNYDWDWKTAEKEYRRAIELNANYATAHHWLAECLAYQGRFPEALAESERARELDPLSTIIAADNGAIYYYSRQYDRAISRFQTVLDVEPASARAHMIIGAYVETGQYPKALASLDQWRRNGEGPWISAYETYIYGRAGEKAKAREAFRQLEKTRHTTNVDPIPLLSVAYAGLDEKDKWIATLQQARSQRSSLPTSFKADPMYDPLRRDPRFQQLERSAGLSE